MTPEEIKSLITSIGALVTACTAIFMVFYKGKELQNFHENILNKRLKSSIDYHEKFVRNPNKIHYTKNIKDAAACDLVGNKNVDAFLVDILLEFHEKKLIDINEMMELLNEGEKLGYLKYIKNNEIQTSFTFHFSKKNNQIYCQANLERIKKSIRLAKIIFKVTSILLIFYTLFFVYLISVSTNVIDFLFPFFFGILTFLLALFFPRLSFAIDQTSIFLERFYTAEAQYRKIKEAEKINLLEEKNQSSVTNFSEYTRSKY
jgi:hypothetical protein